MPEALVKKYIVRLSPEERATLETLINKGRHPAAQLLKARILLKADVSEAGEGWSDRRIVKALDTSPATVARTRQRLVEEGFDAVLARKHSPNSARKRIFDGAAEAKLIALVCSPPPKGRARWTLERLEHQSPSAKSRGSVRSFCASKPNRRKRWCLIRCRRSIGRLCCNVRQARFC